jgi:hypothetical protein
MTREVQKTSERQTLDVVLAALGVHPEREPEAGETPDFILSLSDRRVGVEITMYRSADIVDGGHGRRQVESEWDKLQAASQTYCATRPELRDINVILMLSGSVPPRWQHLDFIKEVADFITAHRHELGSQDVKFWPPTISTPLMVKYLRLLCLRVDRFAVWTSSLTAGFVATPATSTVADIVAEKSAKNFRPVDELWLAIQCSTRISETLLPIEANDFDMIQALDGFRFSRIFVLTYLGVYQWKAGEGWRKLTGEADQQFPAAAAPASSRRRMAPQP